MNTQRATHKNVPTANFFETDFSNILDKHTPFKKITRYMLKFKSKLWITTALQKFISIKNEVFKNFIRKKYINQKNELQNNYEIYQSLISTLMKRSKQTYYTKYFESNLTYIKNTWKDITSIIFMRSSSSITPTALTFQNKL